MLDGFKLTNFGKRVVVSFALVALLLGGGIFALFQTVFKADTTGAFTISLRISDQVNKVGIPDANIIISSNDPNSTIDPVSNKSDGIGSSSITVPNSSFTNITVIKDGFWDMEGTIVNVGNLTSISAGLLMKPGFGKEDIQITALKKTATGTKTWFGLSVNPWDDTSTFPNTTEVSTSYDIDKKQEVTRDANNFQFTSKGQLPEELTDASAVYSPEADEYYIFGGKRTDGTLSDAVYEYDYSRPDNAVKVATLPYANTASSAIYVPEKKQILYFATCHPGGTQNEFYSFEPQTNYNLTSIGKFPAGNNVKAFLANGRIFLAQKENVTTSISSSALSDLGAGEQFLSGKPRAITLTDFTPYYSYAQNKVYLLGGSFQVPAGSMRPTTPTIQDTIYQFNPDDANSIPELMTEKLPYPIKDAIMHRVDNTYYLFGGLTTNSAPETDKMIVIKDESTGISFSGTKDFSLPSQLTSSFASAQGLSLGRYIPQRTIIFSSNTAKDTNAKYIQSLAPVFTLKAGQSYGVETPRDTTIVFKGKAKTDAFTFTNKDINEGNWQAEQPTKFANPYTTDITVGDITINYNNTDYSIKEAVAQNILAPDIWLSGYPTQAKIDLNNPDLSIKPGDFLAFWSKKSGVKINIDKNPAASTADVTSVTVEVPAGISYDDLKGIANSPDNLTPDQDAKFKLVQTKIEQELATKKTVGYEIVHVDLTVNGKYVFFNEPNPAYSKTVAKTSIDKAEATDSTNTFDIQVIQSSFIYGDGTIDPAYFKIKALIDSFELDGDKFGKIKAILGEPYFKRTVRIEKDKYRMAEDNAGFSALGGRICLDTESKFIKSNLEGVILHEVGHSWRDFLSDFLPQEIDEGLAQGFVFAYVEKYKPESVINMLNFKPISNFDQKKDDLEFYTRFLQPEKETYSSMVLLSNLLYGDSSQVNILPEDNYFWARQMMGTLIFKMYLSSGSDLVFFHDYHPNYYNYLLVDDPKCPNCGGIRRYFKIDPKDLETTKGLEKIKNSIIHFRDSMTPEKFNEELTQLEIPSDYYFRNLLIPQAGFDNSLEGEEAWDWLKDKSFLYVKQSADEQRNIVINQKPYLKYPAPKFNNTCEINAGKVDELINPSCDYENNAAVFFSKATKTGDAYEIGGLENEPFFLKLYFADKLFLNQEYSTDDKGVLIIDTPINVASIYKYTGSMLLINIDKNFNMGYDRLVTANNLYMENGQETGKGLYGTADVPDGTIVAVNQVDDKSEPERITFSQEATVNHGIYSIPEAQNISGPVNLDVGALGEEILKTNVVKWAGDYEFDIKTDTTAPAITDISTSGTTIKSKLSEPSSMFVEYGAEQGKYTNVSFGKADVNGNLEGDAFSEGDRQIQTDGFTIPAPFHYRIWAIDQSGNISHTDDQLFEVKEIKNITVKVASNGLSATISWDTMSDTIGRIDYGRNTNYGTSSGVTTKGKTHSITLNNLDPQATYHFRVKAWEDAETDSFYSDDQTFDTRKLIIINSKTTQDKNNIPISIKTTFDTNLPATCSYNGTSLIDNGINHETNLSVMPCEYSTTILTCTANSDPNKSITTPVNVDIFPPPPTITNQKAVSNPDGTVTISWASSHDVQGRIAYQEETYTDYEYVDYSGLNPTVTLSGLSPDFLYNYYLVPNRTVSRDACPLVPWGQFHVVSTTHATCPTSQYITVDTVSGIGELVERFHMETTPITGGKVFYQLQNLGKDDPWQSIDFLWFSTWGSHYYYANLYGLVQNTDYRYKVVTPSGCVLKSGSFQTSYDTSGVSLSEAVQQTSALYTQNIPTAFEALINKIKVLWGAIKNINIVGQFKRL